MADEQKGLVAAGAALVKRHPRVLWWVFAVNFILGGLGSAGAAGALHDALHHSLAGQPLIDRFDLGMFLELVNRPEVNLMQYAGSSYLFAGLFFLFMLFISGGIVEVYWRDRKLTTGEFFAASGAFFWRFVRLLLLSLIPIVILGVVHGAIHHMSDYIDDRVTAAQVSFFIFLIGSVILLLLALCVRLWFDIAQVRTVAQNERGMWRNTWKAFGITWRNLGTLFRAYFCIAFFAWATLAIGLWIWVYLPATTLPVTFILLELIMLAQIVARLWQRATAVTWYQRHAVLVPADVVDYTTPAPVEIVETEVIVESPPVEEPPLRPIEPPENPDPDKA